MHDNGVDVWIGCRRFRTLLAFYGLIDDPQIYSRALSANEIQSLKTPGQVVIISPPTDQTYLPLDGVLITADILNFFAPVTMVDFYEGSRLVGTATEPPYSVVYIDPLIHNARHYVDAVATDTLGNVVTTAPGAFWFNVCDDTYDVADVKIISPSGGSVFNYGDPILIQVVAHQPCYGLFDGIDLYLDSSFLVHQAGSTLDFVLGNAPLGSHWIFARTTGAHGFYDELNITVVDPGNQAPTVAITSPSDGAMFTAPDVTVHVTAQDPDGSVVSIQLTDGRTTFTTTSTDFDYAFSFVGGGNYTLTATAWDNSFAKATSSIHISVVTPPPANDDFANSFDLAQITTGNNFNSTWESGEPGPPYNGFAGHSVWWHWTAPSDGRAAISTEGSSFATVVTIFTGNTVGNLRLIAYNNGLISGSYAAIAQIFATAGMTYQILVADAEGGYGDIQLNVRYDVPPTVAITSPAEGAVFSAGADIPVHVTAQDSDGSVVQIQLTDGTTTFTTTAADFAYTFTSLAVGTTR